MARHRKPGKLLLPLVAQRSRGLYTRTAPAPHHHSHTHTRLSLFLAWFAFQVDSKTRHEALSSEETLAQSVCPEDCSPLFSLGGTAAALLPRTTSGCGRTLNSSRQTRADSSRPLCTRKAGGTRSRSRAAGLQSYRAQAAALSEEERGAGRQTGTQTVQQCSPRRRQARRSTHPTVSGARNQD